MSNAKSRRPKGSGSVRERLPGSHRWQLRAPHGKDPFTGKPQFAVKTVEARTKAQALAELRAFHTELDRTAVKASAITVTDLMNEYVAQRDKVIGGPLIGHVKIAELTPRMLDLFYRKLGEGSDSLRPQSGHRSGATTPFSRRRSTLPSSTSGSIGTRRTERPAVPRSRST